MKDTEMAQVIVDTVTRFDSSFPGRDNRVMLSAYGSLIAELAYQIKKNTTTQTAIEILVEVVKTVSHGTECEVTVHKFHPKDTGGVH